MPLPQTINRCYLWIDKLLSLCADLLANINQWIIFPSILLLVLTDIALRNLINQSISWSHEVLGLLLLSAFFLHLPLCIREKELLHVDLLYQYLKPQHQVILEKLSSLLIALLAIILCWQGIQASFDMYFYEEQAYSLPIPYWPLALLTAICAGLVTLQSLMQVFHRE